MADVGDTRIAFISIKINKETQMNGLRFLDDAGNYIVNEEWNKFEAETGEWQT